MSRRSQIATAATVDLLSGWICEQIRVRTPGFRAGEYINYGDLDRVKGGTWTWSDKRKAMETLRDKGWVVSDAPKGFRILPRKPRIGLVVSEGDRPFIQALQDAIAKAGALIDYVNTHKDRDQEFQALKTLFLEADGVLLNPVMISDSKSAIKHADAIRELVAARKGRLVLIDRPYFQAEHYFCVVQTDNIKGGRMAAEYLFQKYKQQWPGITDPQIAGQLFVAFNYWTTPELERSWGFEQVIYEKVGFEGWPSDRRIMRFKPEHQQHQSLEALGAATADELLHRIRRTVPKHRESFPFTCFCLNDDLAGAVLAKLAAEGIWDVQLCARRFRRAAAKNKPRVVVQGFDGLHVSKTFGFVSVGQPFEEIGERATKLLVKHIEAGTWPEPESRIVLDPKRLEV
jgi:DNA-binding LacI/PurR family transcriptional regulator